MIRASRSLALSLIASMSLACYRSETPLGQAILCPPSGGLQVVRIPFKVSGMGSAHYPGPPYSYEEFDQLTFIRSPDGERKLVRVQRYDTGWPLEKVRGLVEFRDQVLVVQLEYWVSSGSSSTGDWEQYPLNGEHPLLDSDCRLR
jgi:hypothetical protein